MAHYDPWIESHTNLSDHPKVHKLAKSLDIRYPEALGILHLLWYSAMKYAWRDGDLRRYGADAIESSCDWPHTKGILIKGLQNCGFLDGLKVHDWLDFAGRLIRDRLAYEKANGKRTQSVRKPYGKRPSSVANRTVPYRTVPDLTKPTSFPATPEVYRTPDPGKAPASCLVLSYKVMLGLPFDDWVWDKKHFPRNIAAATELLHYCGNLQIAESCLKSLASEFDSKGLPWTLETIARHAPDWLKKNGRANADASRAGLRMAIAQQRSTKPGEGGLVKVAAGPVLDAVRTGESAEPQDKKGDHARRGKVDAPKLD